MGDATDQRPAPSVTGTLAQRPLVHLLVYARNRRLTGELDVRADESRGGAMTFWRGRITSARVTPPAIYFGTLAYELGRIDAATLDASLLELSQKKKLHGEILVARGALTEAERDDVLAEQICRKIHQLFAYGPDAAFSFYEARPSNEEPSFAVDAIAPTWRGIRDYPPKESILDVLGRYATAPLRMVNEGPLSHAGLSSDDLALCEALGRRPLTVGQLRGLSSLPAMRVEHLVYLLLITKCVEPITSSPEMLQAGSSSGSMPAAPVSAPASSRSMPAAPPSSGRAIPAPPPSSQRAVAVSGPPSSRPNIPAAPSRPPITAMPRTMFTPKPAAIRPGAPGSGEMRRSLSFRVPSGPEISVAANARVAAQASAALGPADVGAAAIAHRAQAVDAEDYFKALGLPDGAPAEAARAAFHRLARLWHPDRLPHDLGAFHAEVTTIFSHMTRAHQTLTDPDLRREWLAQRTALAASRPRKDVLRDIDAALSKRDLRTASDEAQRLVDADPDDAEASAIVAWTAAGAGEDGEDALRAALPLLDKAVHTDRDCERAIFYRGLVNKRLGNNTAAYRDFARTVQLNPRHVDAQREVRLYEMRARKGSGEHALDLLINKKKK